VHPQDPDNSHGRPQFRCTSAKWSEWCVAAGSFVQQLSLCIKARALSLLITLSSDYELQIPSSSHGYTPRKRQRSQGRKLTADRRWRTIFIARGWRITAHRPPPRITLADSASVSGKAIILIVRPSGDLCILYLSPFEGLHIIFNKIEHDYHNTLVPNLALHML
jgi:hypothetical protein